MTIRRLCVDEITTVTDTFSQTVTCTNPGFTPIGPGDECNVLVYNTAVNLGTTPPTLSFSFDAQFEYQYEHLGATFLDYCNALGNSGSFTLPTGVTLCCGATVPLVQSSVTCNAAAITTTPTSVSGNVTLSFTVTNLCVQTIICVDDTTCPS
ncbi:MAG: hypothetical protein XD69_0037 [Clostridia bacterium 62_21]|nr:MAG: hypothetical protein XD69_0037 [Clostridia bacterium 62_21]HAG07871.1 hypothetical protein [Peptococcaceae bacterium]